MLAAPSPRKQPIKVPNLKPLRLFCPFDWAHERVSIKMHSIKSRFVIGPSNVLFVGMYMSTFQPGNFTGCGSKGVKIKYNSTMKNTTVIYGGMLHMLSTTISKLLNKRHLKTCLSLNKKHWRILWGKSQENEPLAKTKWATGLERRQERRQEKGVMPQVLENSFLMVLKWQ